MIVIEWEAKPVSGQEISGLLFEAAGDAITNDDAFDGERLYPWPDRVR